MNLYILSPSSVGDCTALVRSGACQGGDLVVDLRRLAPLVHVVLPDQSCQDITATLELPYDPWQVARRWLLHFTRATGLQDKLAIQGFSFWWTLNSLRFAPGWSGAALCFTWIDTLRSVSRGRQFDSIVIHGYHKDLTYCARGVFGQDAVQVVRERNIDTVPPTTHRNPLLLLVRLIVGLTYLPVSLLFPPHVCFLADTSLLRKAWTGAREQVRDVYLGPIQKALKKIGWRTAVIERHGWSASWKGLAVRGLFFPNDIVFLVTAPQLLALGLWRKTVAAWTARWEESRSSIEGHLNHQGVDLSGIYLPLIKDQFLSNGPGLEIMVRFWQWLFRRWSPRLLFVNNSYGRSAVGAIIAAKVLGIPTVEQQHGVIGNNHSAYLIPPGLGAESSPPQCDAILVWGAKTKRLLVESGAYRHAQVRICGFPRMDNLLRDLPSRTDTLGKLGLPTDNPVALYTSNPVGHEYMTDILDSIVSARESERVHWLIKLHPREITRSEWETEIRRRQLTCAHVTQGEFDFHSLLAACDIHVSYVSTTLIEAAVLGKLNLGLAVPGIPDPVGFLADGGYLPVHPKHVGAAVTDLLDDPQRQGELASAQATFANDWCLTDGRALERILCEVEAIIGVPKKRGMSHG
jgi:hypothetical protein